MQYEEFIKHVQTEAQAESRQVAEKAVQATLETIAERIVGNEAAQLAAQLPAEIARFLKGHTGENGDHFPVKEFYRCISEKAGVESGTAAHYAKAVITVLGQAVTPGEFSDVRSNFSQDYAELFSATAEAK